MRMRRRTFAIFLVLATSSGGARADFDSAQRLSGPLVSENLAVYFIHGGSSPGPVPLTLQEAIANHTVRVYETDDVNQLAIENRGAEEVFVQAGDIVKGGKQDRTLTVSLLSAAALAAHSDRVVLRRAGPLVATRPRGCPLLFERECSDAVARGEDRDDGTGRRRTCDPARSCLRSIATHTRRHARAPATGMELR